MPTDKLLDDARFLARMSDPKTYRYEEVTVPRRTILRAIAVGQAYVAEHKKDDAEPIDEAWLRSVGFKASGINDLYANDGYCLSLTFGEDKIWTCGGHETIRLAKQPKTRKDVRRLASALGINLKETT